MVMMPVSSSPMTVKNRPIPALMAYLRFAGMAAMIFSRSGERTSSRKMTPEIAVSARDCCQV